MSWDCEHRNRLLIQSSRGGGDDETVTVCSDCGEFQVTAWKDGVLFKSKFVLASNATLIAASKSVGGHKPTHKFVWKPLDLAHLRLYQVFLYWGLKDGTQGRERYIVAASAPRFAAERIRRIYAEAYDNNPQLSYWHVAGFALDVLQPLEWKENGITLFNEQLISAMRRYIAADPVKQLEERQSAYQEMARLVDLEAGKEPSIGEVNSELTEGITL